MNLKKRSVDTHRTVETGLRFYDGPYFKTVRVLANVPLSKLNLIKMDKDEIINHRQQRMKLWADVWAATCSANDCKSPLSATKFADEALKAFDERFPQPKQESVGD